MQIAHKIELKPNNKQKTYFKKACGVSRFSWNWALAQWNRQYEENKKAEPEECIKISGMSLKKQFNAIKKDKFPWTREVTKYAAQQPFIQLQSAWKRFFDPKLKNRKPQFKKKNKSADSFYIGGDHLKIQDKKICIPKLGFVRLKENLRFKGKINSATISRTADRWFVSIQVKIEGKTFKKCVAERGVGIDLGINRMVTMSDGIAIDSPKPLKKYLRKLKKDQRVMAKKIRAAKKDKRKISESKNFRKQKNKIAKIHMKISNIRKDATQKVTSFVTNNYLHISIEDLQVSGMIKNHNLARAISDIGFGEIRRQLEYKAKIRGNTIYVADRFFPSSKTCSNCKEIRQDLKLKDRIFKCRCGNEMDRDLNAAINLEGIINQNVRPVRSELTPVKITAMQDSVFPILVTSIVESGSKRQAV